MKIGVRKVRRDQEHAALAMASLIDVVFLLLAFFLVTSMLVDREDRLSPNLQADSNEESGEEQDFVPQVLEVMMASTGTVYRLAEREFTERSALVTALKALPKEPGIFVRVSKGPTVGEAAFAIQCSRDAGFSEVTYVPASE
jgi:biopolymer transport protein ExbD